MEKYFKTYFLAIVLISTIALPTYFSLITTDYEVSLVIDMEEESEESEPTKDLELKIFPNINTFFTCNLNEYKGKTVFNTHKEYNSIFQKLDSPPPELS